MQTKNEITYKLPIKVEGYYDTYFEEEWVACYKNSTELCDAIDVISKYIKDERESIELRLSEVDYNRELEKALKLDFFPEVLIVHLPSFFKDKIYKETVIIEEVNLDEVKRVAKLKKIKIKL